MNYLKFTQYAYLIVGILFTIEAVNQYLAGNTNKAILCGGFVLVGIFMFFFRKNFGKKFEERNKKD